MHMKRIIFLGLFCVALLAVAGPAAAVDGKTPIWRFNSHVTELPFPRSERAELSLGFWRVLDGMRFLLRLGNGGLPQGRLAGALSETHRQM